jgi:diguanylate cyclase (GGDEF)-like protein
MTESARLLRQRIETVQHLPTSIGVAVQVIERCRDPESGCADLAELVALDPSLSARFLSLANSAWFGLSRKITRINQAVTLLGVSNAKSLCVSHSLTGLYQGWNLREDDAHAFWQAALLKASAGELLTKGFANSWSEDTFTLGLLQDIGVALMVSCDGVEYAKMLRDESVGLSDRLEYERTVFGSDHAEVGACLAERIGLPQPFPEAIRQHHQGNNPHAHDRRRTDPIRLAMGFFPHDFRCWSKCDYQALDDLIQTKLAGHWTDAAQLMDEVQERFTSLTELLCGGDGVEPSVSELTARACQVLSQTSTTVILESQKLAADNQYLTRHMLDTESKHRDAEERATHDALTGLLNRDGFARESASMVHGARAANRSLALALLDLDDFKSFNDEHGHACGDEVLQAVSRRLQSVVRGKELICRWGGDEFLVMLEGLSEDESILAVDRLVEAVAGDPISWRELRINVRVSVGAEWIESIDSSFDIDALIERVDIAMYQNKRLRAKNFASSHATLRRQRAPRQ